MLVLFFLAVLLSLIPIIGKFVLELLSPFFGVGLLYFYRDFRDKGLIDWKNLTLPLRNAEVFVRCLPYVAWAAIIAILSAILANADKTFAMHSLLQNSLQIFLGMLNLSLCFFPALFVLNRCGLRESASLSVRAVLTNWRVFLVAALPPLILFTVAFGPLLSILFFPFEALGWKDWMPNAQTPTWIYATSAFAVILLTAVVVAYGASLTYLHYLWYRSIFAAAENPAKPSDPPQ